MRNKRILLSLLIYLSFTEMTLAKENSTNNMLGTMGYNRQIRSANDTPVCFYDKNYFQQESFCLNNLELIDFKIEKSIGVHANEIRSIKIPATRQITVYQGEHFFTLTDSILKEAWQKIIGMDEVTKIVATDKELLSCDTHCIITQKMVIPLSTVFSHYPSDTQDQEKSVLLSFETSNNTFNMTFNNFIDITVDDGLISILPPNAQQIDFSLHQGATHISFLFSWFNNELFLSYLETVEGELLHLSPTVSVSPGYSFDQEYIDLAIFNSDDRQPLSISKILMAVHSEPHRTKRGTAGILGCFISGPLALYNVITQGRCNQVESAWQHIKAFFSGEDASNKVVAGTGKPLKPKPILVTSQELTSPTLALTQVNTELHGQSLTLPAVSQYCQTPVKQIIGARYPRQIRHSCATWLSSVLADFTLLFGGSLRTWSTEYLIQTLNGILDRRAIDNDNDALDAFIREPGAGNRLIQTINDVAEEQGRSTLIEHVTRSFAYAEQNYAQYVMVNNPPGASNMASPERMGASCDSESDYDSENDDDSDVASPQQAQQYPLGSYQMPAASYVYQAVLPRILRNGEWFVPQEGFDIEVIQGAYQQNRRRIYDLLEVVAEWENIYSERRVYCDRHGIFPTDMETNRYAGQITSQLIRSNVQYSRQDQTIVIVRFNHQIVSISIGYSYSMYDGTNKKNAVIAATLTSPANVLTPETEGAIRGAGTAALHAMIQHLKADGVTLFEAEVISTPSAMVKKRIGFVFIPDPDDNYPFPATDIPTPEPEL